MNESFRLLPESASSVAASTDALYFFLCAISAFFTLLIFGLVFYFAVKYRRRSAEPPPRLAASNALEAFWTLVPFGIAVVIFFWGAKLYFHISRPPSDAMDIYVIGKQWMWKVQHPNGRREINELHVPLGRAVRVTLSSQDVIHSFYVPAFRIKQDAVPGRYTVTWFRPIRAGIYHLFCAEYCGTYHSHMIGRVVVLEPERYQAWLSGTPLDEAPEEAGASLFATLGCITCHGARAPTLAGLYGSEVRLADGGTARADEQYIRESILDSTAKIVSGYPPIMPSFRNQLTEEQLFDLLAYIKSLKDPLEKRKAQE